MTTATLTLPTGNEQISYPPVVPRWWFNPAFFALAPFIAGLLGWVIAVAWRSVHSGPASWDKLLGFAVPARPTAGGVALLLLWWAVVISVSLLGWRLGSGRGPSAVGWLSVRTPAAERRYFVLVTAVAAMGIAYTIYQVGGPASILASLANQSGNDVSNAMSQTAGLQTLRFATILAAPIGIHLWRKKVIPFLYMLVAVGLLLSSAMISSRLSLLMAGFVYLAIWTRDRDSSAPGPGNAVKRIGAIVGILVIGVGLLTAMNYFRNANYYREAGVTNPLVMNLYQMGAYLTVPAQVSLGVSTAIMNSDWQNPGDPVTSSDAVKPTFLQFKKISKDNSWKDANEYHYAVSFEPNFFTNSVFADTYADFGMWGWFYTFLIYGFAGFLFARLIRYGPVIAGSGGVVAYCFSEIWRIQILSYGIVIFLMLLTVGCAAVAVAMTKRSDAAANA
jgi:oligosaccharide repeat unit polymerase